MSNERAHVKILQRNRIQLVEAISVEDMLYTRLRAAGIITQRQESRLRHSGDPYTQIEALLDDLSRMSIEKYQAFRQVLLDDNQKDVVLSYLPDLLTQESGAGNISVGCEANKDAFDHAKILRKHRTMWAEHLEIEKVINHLIAADALDYRARETVDSLPTRYKKVEYILDTVEMQGEKAYKAFLEGIKANEQDFLLPEELDKKQAKNM